MEKQTNTQPFTREQFVAMFDTYETKIEMLDQCGNANLNFFWNRDNFVKFWNLRAADVDHYHEEKHSGAKFLLSDGTAVKKSAAGNAVVRDFFLLKPSQVLDLTWMKPKTKFRLANSIQYHNLLNILVNVDNLAGSSLHAYPTACLHNQDLDLNLTVHAGKTKLKPNEQVAAFVAFFEASRAQDYHVKSVTLDGFDKMTYNALGSYLHEKGIAMRKRQQLTLPNHHKALKIAKDQHNDVTITQ